MLSAKAKQSALAQQTPEVWIFLLDVDHPGTATRKHYTNNNEDVISGGVTYEPAFFSLMLQLDDESHMPSVDLTIDNVDRDLIAAIRATGDSPMFTVHLVLAGDPDVKEMSITGLTLLEASYDAYVIQGTLYFDDLLNVRYPADIITDATGYNGLFGR